MIDVRDAFDLRQDVHPRRPRGCRAGAMLLEVMVALAILSTAGLASVSLAREAIRLVEHARTTERELADANAFLSVVALWPSEDLDMRLGSRAQGAWRLEITRPFPTLYTLALHDTVSGRGLLRTSVFRPEAQNERH